MDANLSPLLETAKQLALLAETLERRTAAAAMQSEQVAQSLSRTLAGIKGDVDRLVQSAGAQVAQSARRGFDDALADGVGKFEDAVTQAGSKIQMATNQLGDATGRTGTAFSRQVKMSFLAVSAATFFLIAGGAVVLWMEWRAYGDARARAVAANVDAATYAAYAQVNMTSCGGRPCVRLDSKSPRWGDKGQYVLVDTRAAPK